MDQNTARKLAKKLSENPRGRIFIALTEDHLRGDFDGVDPVWVVINLNSPWDRIYDVPEGVNLK